MLHMKWLSLHHCLWEWSSGEAQGSLGQPLWFVLMFWFHNPNILRAVICSLFPFYSVILLFFSVKQSCQQRREAALSGEMEEERDRKMRIGWRKIIWISNKKRQFLILLTVSPVVKGPNTCQHCGCTRTHAKRLQDLFKCTYPIQRWVRRWTFVALRRKLTW